MNRFKRNKFARVLATLALPVTTVALTGNANAACAPAAPVTDSTVTCTGMTNNQNGTIGFGDIADARNTINVIAGASVTGTNLGMRLTGSGIFANAETVNNFGAISGADGIFGFSGIVNNNAGATIAGTGANGVGYLIFSQGALTNSGTISGNSRGVDIQNGTVTNNTTGTITGGNSGVIIQDENLQGVDVPTIINAGSITGGTTGVRFHSAGGNPGDLINSGTISATGANGVGAAFDRSGTVANSGTIAANNDSARAINAASDVTVTNNAGGTISGRLAGIQAAGAVTVNNAQGALIETTEPIFIADAIAGLGNTAVQNSGTIRSLGGSASGIVSEAGLAITNTSTGVITATRIATFASGDATVSNEGLIEANSSFGWAVIGSTSVNVSNGSGTIRAMGGDNIAIGTSGTATVSNGSGLIQTTGQDSSTIQGANVKITNNTGTIEATGVNGIVIGATDTADVTNSGTIQATGDNGIAIKAADAIINNNAGGTISGNSGAISTGTGTIHNAGILSSTKTGNSTPTILATTRATVNNTGTIFAPNGGFGIEVIGPSGQLDLVNSGTISGVDNGIGIDATIANVTNTGTINTGSNAIVAKTGNIENFGTISSGNSGISILAGSVSNFGTIQAPGGNGINIESGTINNSGLISGQSGVVAGIAATIGNSDSIQGAGPGSFGVFSLNAFNIVNSGTISGNTAIQANGQNNVGSVITNAGTIAGAGGTAIKLSPAADTLTLVSGSQIIGVIDMGGGADTININTIIPASRVSSLTTLLPVDTILQNVINFTGTVNAAATGGVPGMPSVASQTQVATLDPTALGQADRTLIDFTGGISSLVRGRLGGSAAGVSVMQVVEFAPTSANDRTNEAFAAISSVMAYGPEQGGMPAGAQAYGHAPDAAPYTVWTSGFGGARAQRADDLMLRSTSSAWGGVIGLDRQVRPDLLLGAFAGGGTGRLAVDLNSQSVDTDYIVGGLYGRFDWVSYFCDFTLQAGSIHNRSTRQVLNDLTPGGSEFATASYNGWYVSPELNFGLRYGLGDGYTATPTVRLRYLAGVLEDYSEAGSGQNLSVGRRILNDVEERAEIELSKITGVSGNAFKASVHGGVIALQRLGSPAINTVLIGQDLSFATPGDASTVGVVAGAGIDFRASANMTMFGMIEGTAMSDSSQTIAAKGGLRMAF